MTHLHDILEAIRAGIHAAREHLRSMRWLRSGGNPDTEPHIF